MSNIRAVIWADAPGLIHTVLAVLPMKDPDRHFEKPAKRQNDDALHLRLIAQALQAERRK